MSSKLCPHTFSVPLDVRRWVAAGCPLVKCAGHFQLAAQLLAARPDLIVVGQIPQPYDVRAMMLSGADAETAAQAFVAEQTAQYQQAPAIRFWEGPNEPPLGRADDPEAMQTMAWYAAFEAERLRRLADLGLRGVAGNFASGTPDLPLWLAFMPALEAIDEFKGYLGLHEFSAPWLWQFTGTYQGNADIPDEGDAGWQTLRYRKVYREQLAPAGFGHIPLIITACGLGPAAWPAQVDLWREQDGTRDPIDYWLDSEKDAARYYAEQLIWYDGELQKDDYVAGAAVFTLGATEDKDRPFDLAGTRAATYLSAYLHAQNLKTAISAPLPKRTTTPAPVARPSAPVRPKSAVRKPTALNLLLNPSFENGLTYFLGETREIAVPVVWRFSFYDANTPALPGQSAPFGRPFTALITRAAVSAADRARVLAGGNYCWKISGGSAPVWVRLAQTIKRFQPGRAYRLAVHILPDLLVQMHPQPAYASDPLASEIRLTANAAGQVFEGEWQTGHVTPFGRYTRLTFDFTAPEAVGEVAVEVRGRWPLPMGAWYVDELSLTTIPGML